jgi:uncharacterized membrane protein (UPF0127 family)
MRPITLILGMLVVICGAVVLYKTVEVSKTIPTTAEFAGVSLNLGYATTTATRERGLGGRSTLPSNYGMLFVFPKPGYYGFWMKDTLIPLDLFWLNAQGQVVYIAKNVATSTYPDVFYPTSPALYVLETAAGFTDEHSVTTSTKLELKNLPTVSK